MAEEFIKIVEDIKKRIKGRTKLFSGDDVYLASESSAIIRAKNLDDLYFKTNLTILEFGRVYKIDSGSFKGEYRVELDDAHLVIRNPTERPLAPILPYGVPVPTTEKDIEEYFQKDIMNGSLEPNQHYKYSSWIVGIPESQDIQHLGIPRGTRLNQLEWCLNHFINDGYGTNHCAITIGCAEALQRYDWPAKTDSDKGSTECLRQILLKIKDNKLNLGVIFRSWDSMYGMPQNLGGFVRLMEDFTQMLNIKAYDLNEREGKEIRPMIEPGVLYATSDGLHIYSHNKDVAKLLIGISEKV